MRIEALKYLNDIRQAAVLLDVFLTGKAFADYRRDAMLRAAVEREFTIIVEAVSQLGKVDQALASRITIYRRIISFRNLRRGRLLRLLWQSRCRLRRGCCSRQGSSFWCSCGRRRLGRGGGRWGRCLGCRPKLMAAARWRTLSTAATFQKGAVPVSSRGASTEEIREAYGPLRIDTFGGVC